MRNSTNLLIEKGFNKDFNNRPKGENKLWSSVIGAMCL